MLQIAHFINDIQCQISEFVKHASCAFLHCGSNESKVSYVFVTTPSDNTQQEKEKLEEKYKFYDV
jgi:hypothetical protein